MQLSDILSAITVIRQRMMVPGGAYDADQVQRRLLIIDAVQDYIAEDDAVGLTDYCQRKLSIDSDTMASLLDEMFIELELTFGPNVVWEFFERKFM